MPSKCRAASDALDANAVPAPGGRDQQRTNKQGFVKYLVSCQTSIDPRFFIAKLVWILDCAKHEATNHPPRKRHWNTGGATAPLKIFRTPVFQRVQCVFRTARRLVCAKFVGQKDSLNMPVFATMCAIAAPFRCICAANGDAHAPICLRFLAGAARLPLRSTRENTGPTRSQQQTHPRALTARVRVAIGAATGANGSRRRSAPPSDRRRFRCCAARRALHTRIC